ncbi:MAG TPA: grasp-with-spasm system SPASM domain peptide maturase [Thermoanaerobaculia bacterium]|nr:grasp-with-spasm system SPASM domain peptide maturase [Thermoanaerobaculia bacterium]
MQDLDNFLSQLKEDASNWTPVSFRTTSKSELEALPLSRYAESTRYRSAQYRCFNFHKPISRIFKAIPRIKRGSELPETERTRPTINSTAPVTDEQIFLLFACCVPVMGARRSIICDLQRGAFQLIPNGLAEILKQYRGKTLAAIKDAYKHQYDAQIERYFEFLIELELGFWCDDIDAFSEIDFSWDEPERITNALIDVDERSEHDFGVILRDLDDLGCKALQVRFYSGGRILQLRELLTAAKGTCLRSIELVAPFHSEDTDQDYIRMYLDFPRISRLIIHSAPDDRELKTERSHVPLIYRRMIIDSSSCCGEVHPSYFVTQISTFSEAQTFNTCLNHKISIDRCGEIKNCPSLPYSCGNIRDTSLHSALAQSDFKQLWAINKDQIEICKDCEFRYICVDCRAYLSRPEDRFSKPAKCTYDPYSAQWR